MKAADLESLADLKKELKLFFFALLSGRDV
jgi:hypothetical protein